MEDDLKTIKAKYLRWPQNIRSGISQQPLFGSSWNVNHKLRAPNQNWILLWMKMTSNGRRPQNIKKEYLRNRWSYLPQKLNLSCGHQTKIKNWSKFRWSPMEYDLKISEVKYPSNLWSDLSQIWNLNLGDRSQPLNRSVEYLSNFRSNWI